MSGMRQMTRPDSENLYHLIVPTLAGVAVAVAAFYVDLIVPSGYTEWPLYLFPLIVVGFTMRNRVVVIVSVVSSAMLILGFVYPGSEDMSSRIAQFHRLLGIGTIWFISYLLLQKNNSAISVLRAKEERDSVAVKFSRMLESNLFGMAIRDANGGIRDANEYFLDLLGASRDEIDAGTLCWDEITPPEFAEADRNALRQLNERGLCPPYEKQYIHKNGSRRWVLVADAALSAHGEEFVAFVLDISRMKETQEAFRESELRFRQLADSMPQMVWTALPNGTMDYCNRRYREFAGESKPISSVTTWMAVIHPEDREETISEWKNSVESGTVYQIQHRLLHSDGTFHWYLSRAIPAVDANGSIQKWYGTATNIDSTKEAEEALRESEAGLRRLTDSLERQVSERTVQVRALSKALTIAEQRERQHVSHILHDDIRQILFAIKMRLELLEDEVKPENKAALAALRNLVDKAMETTISVALELNPPVLRNEGLDAALRWLVMHMEEQHDLEIHYVISGDLSGIRGTIRSLVVQVVRELLYNVERHAGTRKADFTAVMKDGNLRIVVEDKGVGFVPELTTGSHPGTMAVGLSSIRERVQLFGGRMDIESRPGAGARMTVIMPQTPATTMEKA